MANSPGFSFMGSNFLRDWNWNNNLSQLGLGDIVGQLRTQKEPMKRSGYKKMPIRRLRLQQPLEGQIDKSLLSSYAWMVCNIFKILQNLPPLQNILKRKQEFCLHILGELRESLTLVLIKRLSYYFTMSWQDSHSDLLSYCECK